MKTSEFKEIIEDADLEFDDSSWDVTVRNHEDDVLAAIDKEHTGRLKVYYPELFSLNIYDNIVKYAQTTIEERKEKYINVDIPVSDWEKINSGFIFRRDDVNKEQGIMTFFTNDGFDAMFDTLRLIQAKYEDEYKQ